MAVIDLRVLREQPDVVRASQTLRGEDASLVDSLLSADAARREASTAFDSIRNEQKTLGKDIAKATGEDKQTMLARASELSAQVKAAEVAQSEADATLRTMHLRVGNIVEQGVPAGGENDFVVLEEIGSLPNFDFPVQDHLAIGERIGAIDTERGAKVSGARFYYLKGPGAMLEFALLNMAMQQAVAVGFTPMITPVLVKPESMEGTGYLGVHADEIYHLPADDLYLVGTSEVPLAAFHKDEILDAESLPLRYAGFSSCFRREAGSYGKDTRGIIRVHQFDKVEMFSFCPVSDASAEHRRFLEWEKQFLTALELPFRVIDTAAGDLGASAARKFDCEAWLPSQQRFMEVTSTSNCTDFQARRLNIRTRGVNGTEAVAMINGTLCAMARIVVALLENHQRADGSVHVPSALRPFFGRDTIQPLS